MTDEEFSHLYDIEFSDKGELVYEGTVREFNNEWGTNLKTHAQIRDLLDRATLFQGGIRMAKISVKLCPSRFIYALALYEFWGDPDYRKIFYDGVDAQIRKLFVN